MPPPVTGKNLLTAVKGAAGLAGPQMVLKVGRLATLRVVATRPAVQNPSDVHWLTEWRNKHLSAFLTEFIATEPRTASWLENIVGRDDNRILFMIDNADGLTVGYMGLAFIDWNTGYGEADAVVRGLDTVPGLMRAALQTLLAWACGQLGLSRIGVRVRSDNPALGFYRKLGFVETLRVPLISTTDAEGAIAWQESVDSHVGNLFLVHHLLNANFTGSDAAIDVTRAPTT